MKLDKRNTLYVSFMLFSLFFGAGNLIFPPFLGHSAGSATPMAFVGFVATAVVLPVLGVVVVARWGSLDKLASMVHPVFAVVYTAAIYLAIGPGLAIPRAASVPFEMAVAPYLPQTFSPKLGMLLYSLVFFSLSVWLSLIPGKLVDRLGRILTPILLFLLVFLFVAFLIGAPMEAAAPQGEYATHAFLKGFTEGYLTMDTLAGLVFGIVIVTTLQGLKITEEKSILHCTALCGIGAGTLLGLIYLALTFIGAQSSGVYALGSNGVVTLRNVVEQLFGLPGAVLLAAIFTLACLTTCVGLITSVSSYFATLLPKVSYRNMVLIVSAFSFIVCNQGLNTILSISVPVLNAVFPVAIVLILMGLSHKLWQGNPYIYPLTIGGVTLVSLIHALRGILPLGILDTVCGYLPLYEEGFGWVIVAVVLMLVSLILKVTIKDKE